MIEENIQISKKKILESIKNWNAGFEHSTWITLMCCSCIPIINPNIKKRILSINNGEAGSGKSRCTTELMTMFGFATNNDEIDTDEFRKPVIVFNGRNTQMGFFNFISYYNDRYVIYDDKNTIGIDEYTAIKNIISSGKTTWNNHTIDYKGCITINMNWSRRKLNDDAMAIISRGYVANFRAIPSLIKEKINNYWNNKDTKIDNDIINAIGQKIKTMDTIKLNELEEKKLKSKLDIVKIDFDSNISLRNIKKSIFFMEWWKGFWGKLDSDLFEVGADIALKYYYDVDDVVLVYKEIIKKIEAEGGNVDSLQTIYLRNKVEEFFKIKKSQAYNKINNAVDTNQLEYIGVGNRKIKLVGIKSKVDIPKFK